MKIKSLVIGTATALSVASMAMADRGSDGHVNIIYWQAPSILNPYLSGGTKDLESSSMIIEPLARYDQDGNLVPWLVDTIPTVDNGGVSEDLKTITWKLSEGLKKPYVALSRAYACIYKTLWGLMKLCKAFQSLVRPYAKPHIALSKSL